jgi:hypothetical protein
MSKDQRTSIGAIGQAILPRGFAPSRCPRESSSSGRPCAAWRGRAAHVVAGWKKKFPAAMANVVPESVPAEQHRKAAQPGSARH